ncbi:MAG: long-chain fatty acid--CoA ligase [Candidatus Lokiarchaeota archaeon]|nr:long-chain fatty acid--CoA ligase [Candidatus Lokiarchaeota archaeon]
MKKSPFKDMFDIKADNYEKDRIASVYGDIRYTWKEEQERVNRLAYYLKKNLNVKKGDKVAVLFHNSPEFMESNLAVQTLGAIPVPVNYRYVLSELEHLLNDCDAVGLLFEGELLDLAKEVKPLAPKVKFYITTATNPPDGMINYEEALKASKNKNIKTKMEYDDIAVIIYTGGTTGRPKGVMLTYENMLSNQESTITLLTTFLPPIKDLDYPKFARSKGEEKLLVVLNYFLGSMYQGLFTDPNDDKVVVFEIPTKKGVSVPPMTLKQVEGRLKMFQGKPEQYEVAFEAGFLDQIRDMINFMPMSHSTRGKIKLMPKLIKNFIFGGIKLKAQSFGQRIDLIKSLSKKPENEHVTHMLITPPMFHLASYALWILNWLVSGAKVIIPKSQSFEPAEIIELIEREQVTWTFFVPTQWKWIVKYLDENQPDKTLDSLEVAFSGAALLRAKVKKQILSYFPKALLLDVFGQTEMAPAASVKIDGEADTVRDRSVGKPVVDLEVRVVDENGNNLPEGETGELLYRSKFVMKGYYGDKEKTDATIDKDGWLHSGDLGYMKDGELYTIERKKECINTGAEKVFPLEVEEVILDHPAVENVVVIGVPDEEWGSTVRAVVIKKPGKEVTAQEIMDFCKGKMAGYKRPRSVVFATEFPISPVGKVLRQKVRDSFGQPDMAVS